MRPYEAFYPAEDDHQNFYQCNPWQPYASFVIKPKVEKAEYMFKDLLKGAPDM